MAHTAIVQPILYVRHLAYSKGIKSITASKEPSGSRSALIIVRDARFQGRGGDAGGDIISDPFLRPKDDPFVVAKAFSRLTNFDVYLSNDFSLASRNATSLPEFPNGSALRIIRDGSLEDKGTTDNVEEALKSAKIDIVEAGRTGNGQPAVVMFAGHATDGFQQMVLNRAAGKEFEGSILAFAVCGDAGQSKFNTEVIRTSGAKAVIFYDQKINPTAVQAVLSEFANSLLIHGADGDFIDIWRRCVDNAISKNDSAAMTPEFEKLREVVIQLSKRNAETVDHTAGLQGE